MATPISITKDIASLRVLFDKIKNVYFIKEPKSLAELQAIDMELPVISDGVSFDTGAPSETKVKLTTGETWTSIAEAGDPSITFQVGSFAAEVCELFLNKVEGEEVFMGGDDTTASGYTLNGKAYKGTGYNLEAKKTIGGLLLLSEDKSMGIYMPKNEIFSSLVIEEGKPAYFNISVTPVALEGAEGTIIPLYETEFSS